MPGDVTLRKTVVFCRQMLILATVNSDWQGYTLGYTLPLFLEEGYMKGIPLPITDGEAQEKLIDGKYLNV
jgi:hypothetical protein